MFNKEDSPTPTIICISSSPDQFREAADAAHVTLMNRNEFGPRNLQKWQGRRVIYVDDKPLNLETFRMFADKYGVFLETFKDPTEVVAKLNQIKPDLIITDANMPKMNGIKLAQAIIQYYAQQS